jgi:hypothetical protein
VSCINAHRTSSRAHRQRSPAARCCGCYCYWQRCYPAAVSVIVCTWCMPCNIDEGSCGRGGRPYNSAGLDHSCHGPCLTSINDAQWPWYQRGRSQALTPTSTAQLQQWSAPAAQPNWLRWCAATQHRQPAAGGCPCAAPASKCCCHASCKYWWHPVHGLLSCLQSTPGLHTPFTLPTPC